METENILQWDTYDRDKEDRTRRYFGDFYQKIRRSPVLVIGAGAIGCETVKNLVMMGVHKIYLVDFDKVTGSNLNRCVFFRPDDHNVTYKVDAIVREIGSKWPECEIIPYRMPIQEAPEEVWNVPLVIVAVDNNEARYYTNVRLFACPDPPFLINGAMGRTFLEVQVLLPGTTACLVCAWNQKYLDSLFEKMVKQSCDQFFHEAREFFPSISVLNSIIGGIMASEAVKILIGLERWKKEKQWEEEHVPLLGQALRYDIVTHEFSTGKFIPNPACVEIFCRTARKGSGKDRKGEKHGTEEDRKEEKSGV